MFRDSKKQSYLYYYIKYIKNGSYKLYMVLYGLIQTKIDLVDSFFEKNNAEFRKNEKSKDIYVD